MPTKARGRGSTLKLLCDGFDAMESAKTADDLRVEMDRFSHEMGFKNFAYALTINAPSLKTQQYLISGFPPQWVERYVSRDFFKVDPVVLHAERSTLPIIWSDHMFIDGKSAEFWEQARSFGLLSGVSFAVHEQPGVTGIFSLAKDKADELQEQNLISLIGRAQLFASLLHHAVARIALPALLPQNNVSLTARERECLKWAADGKTAWEIGRILSIAERTAVFHVSNVMRKLGAANRTQAIVRAVALKLV